MISIYEAVLLITITGLYYTGQLDNKMLLCNVAEFIQANITSYMVVVPGSTKILSMSKYFLNRYLYCEAFKHEILYMCDTSELIKDLNSIRNTLSMF